MGLMHSLLLLHPSDVYQHSTQLEDAGATGSVAVTTAQSSTLEGCRLELAWGA